jgi:hypothetical protein
MMGEETLTGLFDEDQSSWLQEGKKVQVDRDPLSVESPQ